MNYSEKAYKEVEVKNEGFAGDYIKMPSFVTKLWLKANVKKMRSMMGGVSKDISVRPIEMKDMTIKGYKSDIRVRVYTPDGDEKRPLMMFFHGGGWFGGSIDAVCDYCKAVADRADCVVVSVDYHLAPEAPFPEGLEDCYAAVKWAVENHELLHIDQQNVVVSGDSAGGNYAAVISLMARDRKEMKIAKQILIYPATDLTVMVEDSADKQAKAFGEVVLGWYLKKKTEPSHPYVSPAKCEDLSQLPPAFIVVGDLDFLKEPSLAYAKKLEEAGNEVTFSLYTNTNHAFIDNTGNCEQAEDLIEEVTAFIRG